MADVTPTKEWLEQFGPRIRIVTWETLTNANTSGSAVQMPQGADRSVQFVGTFDSATVKLQGSNDGVNYHSLTDPQGNAIEKTAAAIEQITEITRYIKPVTTGGGASQDVDVFLLVKDA